MNAFAVLEAGTLELAALALSGASVALVFPALAVWVVEAAPDCPHRRSPRSAR